MLLKLSNPASRAALRRFRAMFVIMWLMAVSGRSAAVDLKRLPDDLKDEGLVIMQVGPYRWHDGEIEFANGDRSEIHNGFFVESLKPGEYTIASIRIFAGANTTGPIMTTYYSTVSLNRRFEIKAGEVTRLGLAYLLEEPGEQENNSQREYVVLWFDDQGAEMTYLNEYYPELGQSLASAEGPLAAYDYANPNIEQVRVLLPDLYLEQALEARKWD